MVFAREANDNLASLVKEIDAASVKANGPNSFVVFLSDDEEAAKGKVEEFAKKNNIQKTVMSIDNVAGPQAYKVAKEADVTVVMYNKRKVEANHAFRKGELDSPAIRKVVADIPKILPSK